MKIKHNNLSPQAGNIMACSERPRPEWLATADKPMAITRDNLRSFAERAGRLFRFVPFILLVVAIFILRRELAAIKWNEVLHTVSQVNASGLVCMFICAAISYSCAGASDWLGARYMGSELPVRKIVRTAVLARAFSNTIGVGMLSGGVIRFRYYTDDGVGPAIIARIIVFYSFGCAVGLLAISGLVLLLSRHQAEIPHFSSARPLAMLLLGLIAAYLVVVWRWRRPVRILDFQIPPLGLGLACKHLPFAMLDWLAAAFALYFLMPAIPGISMDAIFSAFFLAVLVGHVSGVPSGIGIFEAAVIIFLGGGAAKDAVLPWLILYRLVFCLIPFCMALLYVATTLSGGIRSLTKQKPPA